MARSSSWLHSAVTKRKVIYSARLSRSRKFPTSLLPGRQRQRWQLSESILRKKPAPDLFPQEAGARFRLPQIEARSSPLTMQAERNALEQARCSLRWPPPARSFVPEQEQSGRNDDRRTDEKSD